MLQSQSSGEIFQRIEKRNLNIDFNIRTESGNRGGLPKWLHSLLERAQNEAGLLFSQFILGYQ